MGLVWTKIQGINADTFFSYQTVKFVKIQDKRLGILHYFLQFCIFVYIVVYTIIIQQRYIKTEIPAASIRATARQPSAANLVNASYLPYCYQNQANYLGNKNYNCTYLLGLDVTYPPAQLESILISTRIKDTYYIIPPNCDSDVPLNFECAPSMDTTNEFRYYVANIENFTIFMEHSIFARTIGVSATNRDGRGVMKFRDGSGRSIDFNDPTRAGDIIDLKTILAAADIKSLDDPSGIGHTYRYDGGLITVVIEYSNEVLHPDRIHYKYNMYHIPNVEVLAFGPSTVVQGARLQRNYYGIRLAFLVAGNLGKFDFPTLLTALVNGVVLVKLATVVVDVLLLFVLPQKEIYTKHKFEVTEEFGKKKTTSHASLREMGADSTPSGEENYYADGDGKNESMEKADNRV